MAGDGESGGKPGDSRTGGTETFRPSLYYPDPARRVLSRPNPRRRRLSMDQDRITIVSGLPRSGTSMMMRMIVAAGIPALTDNLRTADEDNPNGYLEFEPVKHTKADPSWLPRAHGRVVKMVHLLLPDLPVGHEYRIVLMRRDLDEVVASQRKMLAHSGRKSGDGQLLMRVYRAQLESVRRFMDSRGDIRWMETDYNMVLASPLEGARRVAEFLGVPGMAAHMAAAIDPTLYRNRRPEL